MIWLLSKAGRIQANQWTGKPSELAYYCYEGDPKWAQVNESIREEYCKRKEPGLKHKKPAKRKTGGDLHDKAANWRHSND